MNDRKETSQLPTELFRCRFEYTPQRRWQTNERIDGCPSDTFAGQSNEMEESSNAQRRGAHGLQEHESIRQMPRWFACLGMATCHESWLAINNLKLLIFFSVLCARTSTPRIVPGVTHIMYLPSSNNEL